MVNNKYIKSQKIDHLIDKKKIEIICIESHFVQSLLVY